jgi:hypothetical protein
MENFDDQLSAAFAERRRREAEAAKRHPGFLMSPRMTARESASRARAVEAEEARRVAIRGRVREQARQTAAFLLANEIEPTPIFGEGGILPNLKGTWRQRKLRGWVAREEDRNVYQHEFGGTYVAKDPYVGNERPIGRQSVVTSILGDTGDLFGVNPFRVATDDDLISPVRGYDTMAEDWQALLLKIIQPFI